MADLTLYHIAPSRSSITLWMLEEVGVPYEIKLLKMSEGDNLKPDYLAVNPLGKVPALKHGDSVITEVAAICTYLADEFPAAKLNVPVGTPRRGIYLKWLFFGPSVIEPAMTDRAFPRQETPRASALGWRDFDAVLDVVAKALEPGPYLMGEQFTAADVVIGSGLRYGMMFKMIPERKEFSRLRGALRGAPGGAARGSERQGIAGEVSGWRAQWVSPPRLRPARLQSGQERTGTHDDDIQMVPIDRGGGAGNCRHGIGAGRTLCRRMDRQICLRARCDRHTSRGRADRSWRRPCARALLPGAGKPARGGRLFSAHRPVRQGVGEIQLAARPLGRTPAVLLHGRFDRARR